jgi:hypothetical protein
VPELPPGDGSRARQLQPHRYPRQSPHAPALLLGRYFLSHLLFLEFIPGIRFLSNFWTFIGLKSFSGFLLRYSNLSFSCPQTPFFVYEEFSTLRKSSFSLNLYILEIVSPSTSLRRFVAYLGYFNNFSIGVYVASGCPGGPSSENCNDFSFVSSAVRPLNLT